MRRMIIAGMKDQKDLPELPPPPEHSPGETTAPGRRRTGRRPQATARSEC
jgi:hypothetical protein